MNSPLRRRVAPTVATAIVIAGLGSLVASGVDARGAASVPGIDADQCARNEAAGTITYLTNFQFAATPGILDVVAAEGLGYFDELCLDVDVRAGDGTNPTLVAAGTATLARVGSPNDLVVAQANGVDAVAIATYTNAPQIVLITMAGEVDELADLEGTTLGYKGAMPPEISAMIDAAGVDLSAIETVSVGFDPMILPRGQVDALTGFKSNEVVRLGAAGEDIVVFDPMDYGVFAASGSIIANREWLDANRETAADFLAATFRALEHCEANVDECLDFAEERATSGYDRDGERGRWGVEIEQLRATQLDEGVGVQTIDQWERGASLLTAAGVVDEVPSLDAYVLEALAGGTQNEDA